MFRRFMMYETFQKEKLSSEGITGKLTGAMEK